MAGEADVVGLREARNALRRFDAELGKELTRRLRTEVAGPVAARIKARIPVGPAKGGHWRSDIRAGANARGVYVQWGRKTRVYAPHWEFGGRRPYNRPRTPKGRVVYPEVEKARPEAFRSVQRVIDDLARRTGLD